MTETLSEQAAVAPSPWLDYAEAARRVHLSVRSLKSLVKTGGIPHRRVKSRVLFNAAELDRWIDNNGQMESAA